MDTNMEDVGKLPEPSQLSSLKSEPTTVSTLDGWIESLMSCKQLKEEDVQRLCDKVFRPFDACSPPARWRSHRTGADVVRPGP